MSDKIGKKNAFIASQSISIVGYILLWFYLYRVNPICLYLLFPSFGIGALFTLMMSMTADVCDLDELKSGLREKVFWRNLLVDGQVWFCYSRWIKWAYYVGSRF
jgi:GPH family glycoside/pentoside/hexuronide:cation symporter